MTEPKLRAPFIWGSSSRIKKPTVRENTVGFRGRISEDLQGIGDRFNYFLVLAAHQLLFESHNLVAINPLYFLDRDIMAFWLVAVAIVYIDGGITIARGNDVEVEVNFGLCG